jgi:hypothetical protein
MNPGGETEAVSFPEIEELIKRLDQSTYTQVILNGENNYLLIGGGKGQYIVVFAIGADDDFYTLLNDGPEDDAEEVNVVTGGQEGSFHKNTVVDYYSVIKAGSYYYRYFDKNPDLLWINE